VGESGTHERGVECMQGLDGKAEGKRPIGRTSRRWENSVEFHLRKIEWGVWIRFMCLRIGTSCGLF
jgi:hypothetical protein